METRRVALAFAASLVANILLVASDTAQAGTIVVPVGPYQVIVGNYRSGTDQAVRAQLISPTGGSDVVMKASTWNNLTGVTAAVGTGTELPGLWVDTDREPNGGAFLAARDYATSARYSLVLYRDVKGDSFLEARNWNGWTDVQFAGNRNHQTVTLVVQGKKRTIKH